MYALPRQPLSRKSDGDMHLAASRIEIQTQIADSRTRLQDWCARCDVVFAAEQSEMRDIVTSAERYGEAFADLAAEASALSMLIEQADNALTAMAFSE